MVSQLDSKWPRKTRTNKHTDTHFRIYISRNETDPLKIDIQYGSIWCVNMHDYLSKQSLNAVFVNVCVVTYWHLYHLTHPDKYRLRMAYDEITKYCIVTGTTQCFIIQLVKISILLGIRWFDLVTTEDLPTRTNEQRVEEQKKDVGDGAGLDTSFEDLTQTLQKGL